MEEQNNELNNKIRWKNRRRMAWSAFVSILVVTALCLFVIPESRLKILTEIITWFYFINGGIIAAYMGFTTMASIKGSGSLGK
jgi:hypothetical protein